MPTDTPIPLPTREELEAERNVCPKCGDEFDEICLRVPETLRWNCRTKKQGTTIYQSETCRIRQLTQQVAELMRREQQFKEMLKNVTSWTDAEIDAALTKGEGG